MTRSFVSHVYQRTFNEAIIVKEGILILSVNLYRMITKECHVSLVTYLLSTPYFFYFDPDELCTAVNTLSQKLRNSFRISSLNIN